MGNYIRDLEVKGSTVFEKHEKLINIKKYLEEKGAKSSYNYTDSSIQGEGWLTYKLGETDIFFWVRKPNLLEFLILDSCTSKEDSSKKSQGCTTCNMNMKYIIRVQTKKLPKNVDNLVEELSNLI